MRKFWIVKVIAFVVIGVFVFGFVVTQLWNCLLPPLFHFPFITFWQGIGLLLLSKIFFGGFHKKGGGCGCGGGNSWKSAWRGRWEAKLASMTPEEREKIKADWRGKCGPPWKWNDSHFPEETGSAPKH
jgi:hypothetical protein